MRNPTAVTHYAGVQSFHEADDLDLGPLPLKPQWETPEMMASREDEAREQREAWQSGDAARDVESWINVLGDQEASNIPKPYITLNPSRVYGYITLDP